MTGLTNGATYSFTVTATNAIGTSASSSNSVVVTPALATFTVQFDSNGGSAISSSTFVQAGTIAQPANPSKQGFSFVGWSRVLNDVSTQVSFPFTPSAYQNLTLYALWAAVVVPTQPAPVTPTIPQLPPTPSTASQPVVAEPTKELVWTANTVRQIVLTGKNLNLIKSVTIGGKPVKILRKLPTKLVLKLPNLQPGSYALDMFFGAGKVQTRQFIRLVEEPDNKLNVGSFEGKVVLYVKGFEGKRISAKVGDHWIVIPSASGDLTRVVLPVGLGYELNVELFINRKRSGEIFLLTH